MSAPTRDEVIQMAREAGGTVMQPYDYGASPDRIVLRYEALERFAAAAYARGASAEREARQAAQTQVAELQERLNRDDAEKCAAVLAEREACACICDDMTAPADIHNATARSRYLAATDDCAAAIRARGQA